MLIIPCNIYYFSCSLCSHGTSISLPCLSFLLHAYMWGVHQTHVDAYLNSTYMYWKAFMYISPFSRHPLAISQPPCHLTLYKVVLLAIGFNSDAVYLLMCWTGKWGSHWIFVKIHLATDRVV